MNSTTQFLQGTAQYEWHFFRVPSFFRVAHRKGQLTPEGIHTLVFRDLFTEKPCTYEVCCCVFGIWFLVYTGPKMKLGSCCRERKMQFSGPTLRSLANFNMELERFWCSLSVAKACMWNIRPDNKICLTGKFVTSPWENEAVNHRRHDYSWLFCFCQDFVRFHSHTVKHKIEKRLYCRNAGQATVLQ